MPKVPAFTRTDYVLWTIIVIYSGVIYATASIVSGIRKMLVEKFGYGVFDFVYVLFAVIGVLLLAVVFRKFRGNELCKKIAIVGTAIPIYAYYLTGTDYAVERIHFLQYGLLGVLVFCAVKRHVRHWLSIFISVSVVFWIGLLDEAIQGILPSRVGEMSDSILNLIAGMLGISLWYFLFGGSKTGWKYSIAYARIFVLCCVATTVFTAAFLVYVHGFGYAVENLHSGRFYTSLSPSLLLSVHSGKASLGPRDSAVYENEAIRHLYQREFYLTNDFLGADGTLYRNYYPAFFENRILENWYGAFLKKNKGKKAGPLIEHIQGTVSEKASDNPVFWTDSLRNSMDARFGNKGTFYTSRVKSTLITSFTMNDVIFYALLIVFMLVYIGILLGKPGLCSGEEQVRGKA